MNLTNYKIIKRAIHQQLLTLVDKQIYNAQHAVESALESKNNETKSSAGDKYETGRAMMQIEQEKNEMQLSKAKNLKQQLNQLDVNKRHERITLGSLVSTEQGSYYISIGWGKLTINEEVFYAISSDSPLGREMIGHAPSDIIQFREKPILILDVA